MLEVTKFSYRLVFITEDNKQYNITDYIENLGWEENEKELSVRITFTAKNDKTSKGKLSSLIKPGCLVGVFVDYGSKNEEVARGYVIDWKPSLSSSKESIEIKCYDELYNLQESQDNIFFSSGISTKSAISQIFDKWEITLGAYEGPDVSHGQLVYRSESLADVVLKILDDAKKKGGDECVVRSSKGKVSIIPVGYNTTVYHFASDNSILASHKLSTAGMVTRVIVIGEEDDDGRRPLEATLNGQTKYGIRQKIYTRGSDESIDDARNAAKDILNDKGSVQQEIKVKSPDVPYVRKGDTVHVEMGTLSGYYFVKGIQHDADNGSMTMELKKAETKTVNITETSAPKTYNVGDIVNFHGGTHYVSSEPGAIGYPADAGKAKITIKNGAGGAHPWHLVHADKGNVYGWVDDGTFD